jgi:hypothetical protein
MRLNWFEYLRSLDCFPPPVCRVRCPYDVESIAFHGDNQNLMLAGYRAPWLSLGVYNLLTYRDCAWRTYEDPRATGGVTRAVQYMSKVLRCN